MPKENSPSNILKFVKTREKVEKNDEKDAERENKRINYTYCLWG